MSSYDLVDEKQKRKLVWVPHVSRKKKWNHKCVSERVHRLKQSQYSDGTNVTNAAIPID